MVLAVGRLQPSKGKGFAEFLGRLFKYQTDELHNGQVNLGIERRLHSREPTDSQNFNGMVIGNAVIFDLEKEALDDPACHAVDAFPVECDGPLVA